MEEQQYRNALPKGFKLFEYEIKSVLGKPGGFGITYLAKDTHLHQLVAIKEYLPSDFAVREGEESVYVKSVSHEESFQWGLQCFIEEARVLARFSHSSIARVLRFFEANGTAYMVMEYQKGDSLAYYLKQKRILTEPELLEIVMPLLDGLKEMHLAGFLHRDIKPNNIYIRDDKTPVLIDFGSARFAVGQKSRSVTSIVTPGYAPLEQYDNQISDQGPWTDIYALGAVMYNAIKGEPPPAATRRVMKDPTIPAIKIGQNKYSQNLLKAIDWALQLSEEDRPQTVDQWREAMLKTNSQKPTKSYTVFQLNYQLWHISYLFIISLLIAVITYLGYENHQYNTTMAYQVQKIHSEATKEIQQVEKERIIAVNELANISTNSKNLAVKHKKLEKKYKRLKKLVDNFSRFESGLLINQTKHSGNKKHFNIDNVSTTDILNIREFPGHMTAIIGQIPANGKCILYIDKYQSLGNNLWVKIRYQKTTGWVNTHYLTESNEKCNGDDQLG
ncbi:MAG: protein kinase [Thiomargarita sp.]|nr:protein kinase [Thiomargarita sp.]